MNKRITPQQFCAYEYQMWKKNETPKDLLLPKYFPANIKLKPLKWLTNEIKSLNKMMKDIKEIENDKRRN